VLTLTGERVILCGDYLKCEIGDEGTNVDATRLVLTMLDEAYEKKPGMARIASSR